MIYTQEEDAYFKKEKEKLKARYKDIAEEVRESITPPFMRRLVEEVKDDKIHSHN